MFCQYCGAELGTDASACSKCGHERGRSATDVRGEIGRQVKASSRDALGAVRTLAANPVGGLPSAFVSLGDTRARGAGFALSIVFALSATVGFAVGARRWVGGLLDLGGSSGVGTLLKAFLALLVAPAALTVAGFGVRKVLGAKTPVAADIFTAGAALLPLGFAILVSGLLGIANFEVVALLFLFAWTYLVLVLYTGLTKVGGISERAGASAVPVVLVLAAWLSKIVFAALFKNPL